MKKNLNYIASFLCVLPGIAAFVISPEHFTSFIGGLVVQVIVAAFIIFAVMPDSKDLKKFTKQITENPKDNWMVLVILMVAYLGIATLIAVGIKAGWLRFVLFLIMWTATATGMYVLNEIIFCKVNRNQLEEQLKAENQEKEIKLQQQREARIAAEEAQAQKLAAEKAALNQAAEEINSKSQPRVLATPDPMIYSALISGLTLGWDFAMSGLQMALSNPSLEALAAVEEAIAMYANNKDLTFYRLGGQRVYSNTSINDAVDRILGLALTDSLVKNPALTQSFIAELGTNANASNNLMNQLSFNPKILFQYRLLGVQMQLAYLLTKK